MSEHTDNTGCKSQGGGPAFPSDTELLDWLQSHTSRLVIWRWSTTGRGWRLHETSRHKGFPMVRQAIHAAMLSEQRREGQS